MRASDSGSYICLARNSLGASDELTANINVQYAATDIRTDPANQVDLEVGDQQVSYIEYRIFYYILILWIFPF